jgi:RND family efflux transporter MFP subunit
VNRAFLPPLALAVLIAAGCSSGDKGDKAPVVRPVMAMTVGAGVSAGGPVYSGEVRARREGDLGFRVPGKIIARVVDLGTSVKKGQALARLDPTDNQMNADASRAAVAAAKTDLQFASAELDRYKTLFEKNFVSKTVLEQKSATYDAAKSRLDQAESQAGLTRNQVGYTTLLADQDGVITAVLAEAGQVVAAGQPVMRLARPEEKEVLISIPETRLAATRAAKEVAVRLWANPEKIYRGQVREVAPSADAGTRTFATRVSILGADAGVALGMTANVLFPDGQTASGNAAGKSAGTGIVIPLTALSRDGDKTAVWIIDAKNNQVALRPVAVKQYREDGIVIGSGLTAGDLIAVAGVHKLVAGQIVRPVSVPTAHAMAPASATSRVAAPAVAVVAK